MFELCSSGGPDALENIKQELELDPKKHMRSVTDKDHLLNRACWNHQTPLYLSCKHGNQDVVKFLLE